MCTLTTPFGDKTARKSPSEVKDVMRDFSFRFAIALVQSVSRLMVGEERMKGFGFNLLKNIF